MYKKLHIHIHFFFKILRFIYPACVLNRCSFVMIEINTVVVVIV